jgi:hypothetical protein
MSRTRTSMPRRLLRCARLHADTYEEIEADHSALGQAFLVVVVAAGSATLGGWLETLTWHTDAYDTSFALGLELAARAIEPVLLWLGGAAFAYMVGSSFFRGPETETDYAEVLRTSGFAFGPGWLAFLVWLPPASLGIGVLWIVRIWTLLAFTVSVRQALDFTTGRAVGTVVVGWAVGWLVMWGAVSVTLQLLDMLG